MKNIFYYLLLLFTYNTFATVHVVTSNSDNYNTPVEGMLRYYVNNASNGDTIIFNVDSVALDTTLRITKDITIDGNHRVVLDAAQNGRVINISFRKVTLKNLTIQNGHAEDYGGGMYAYVSSDDNLIVENCIFKNNTVTSSSDGQGGGIRTNYGTYTNCQFINNQVLGSTSILGGGGAYAVGGKFINCVFAGNSAKYGGGMYSSNATVLNCTFTQNEVSVDDNGGGLNCENSTVINTILYNNIANSVENNIENFSSTVSYSALEDGNTLVGSNDNIGLTESPFTHSGSDSLALKEASSCINVGNSTAPGLPAYDIVGENRLYNGIVDLGAFEYFVPLPIYLMSNDTVGVDSVRFYDSGGRDGNFNSGEFYTMTFYPKTAGKSIRCIFSSFYTATVYNNSSQHHGWLYVYNGKSVESPLIAAYSSNDIPVDQIQATNADGALTFYFLSFEPSIGWAATISEVQSLIDHAPVSMFSYDTASHSTPLEVQFKDYSYQNPTSWLWDFGDGLPTSSDRNPTHTYTETGIYNVALVTTNNLGSDTLILPVKTGDVDDYYMGSDRFVTTNLGLFYDDGGPDMDYTMNRNDTITFYPATIGKAIEIDFFKFESDMDYLYVFNGNSTTSPLIGKFRNKEEIGKITPTNAMGALTIVFSTDNMGQLDYKRTGWQAIVKTIPSHSAIFNSGNNGTLTGDTIQLIPYGRSSNNVTAVPNEGYHFVQWENTTGDYISNLNPLTLTNIIADTTLLAKFEIDTFTIRFYADENGYLEGDILQTVDYGEDAAAVTAIANNGHQFLRWENEFGNIISYENTIIVRNVADNFTLIAVFSGSTNIANTRNTDLFEFYPNPFSNEINVTITDEARVDNSIIQLLSADGKIILQQQLQGNSTLNTEDLNTGVYIMRIISGAHVEVIRLVKN